MNTFYNNKQNQFVPFIIDKDASELNNAFQVLGVVGEEHSRIAIFDLLQGISRGFIAGVYDPASPHPLQNETLPFAFNPSTQEYIGFRCDMTSITTYKKGTTHTKSLNLPYIDSELLQKLPALTLAPVVNGYFVKGVRITVVMFRVENCYFDQRNLNRGSVGRLHVQEPNKSLHDTDISNSEVLQQAGYNAVRRSGSEDITLLNPLRQVTRTMWFEF